MRKIDIETKARELQVLVKKVKHLKRLLEKHGCEVHVYLSEDICIVKKRLI